MSGSVRDISLSVILTCGATRVLSPRGKQVVSSASGGEAIGLAGSLGRGGMLFSTVVLVLCLLSSCATSVSRFLYHSVLLRAPSLHPGRPPIVILHGLLGSSRNFQSWTRILSQKLENAHDIVVIDLPLHGRSVALGNTLIDFQAIAKDVLFTLQKLGVTSCHLIGHSLGGKCVAQASLLSQKSDSPLEVLSTTLIDISPIAYESEDFSGVLSTIDFLSSTREEFSSAASRQDAMSVIQKSVEDKTLQQFLMSNLQPRSSGVGFDWKFLVDGIASSKERILGFPLSPDGPTSFSRPVLLLKGSKSRFIKSSHMAAISELFPLFTLATIDAGHWLHQEKPEESASAIAKFLGKVREFHEESK